VGIGVDILVVICDACGEQHPVDDPDSCEIVDEIEPWPSPRILPADVPVMIRTPHPLPLVRELEEL
jgi:hypothetical protein